jgi:hypothetical protein
MSKTDYLRATDRVQPGSGGGGVTLSGGSGGDAQTLQGYRAADFLSPGYLTLSADANLRNERVLTIGDGLEGTDAGANAAYTLAVKLKAADPGLVADANGLYLGTPGTLSVASANAVTVAAHTHAVTSSASPGAAASILASSAQGYLQLVRLGIAVAPGYPLQAQGTTPQLRLQQDAGNYSDFGVDAGGDLTVTPSGDSFLIPGAKTLASADWASQTTGWGIYPESTHGRSGYADFRYLYADEMHVKMFIADLEQALAGGQIIAKSVAILAADFTIPAKGSAATLRVEDLPGTTAAVFVSGDWVRIRNISRDGGGLVVADAYGTVGSATLNGDGTQSYTWTRPAGDTGSAAGGTVVLKGGLAIDYGVSGNGYWEVTTLDPAGSPYAQVATWATHPQNLTVRLRLGNLDGIAGIGAEWGLWAGRSSSQYVKVSDAGAEIKGLTQTWIDSAGNARGMVDPTATGSDYLFWLGPSSGDKRFGVNAAGTVYIGNVPSSNVAGWAHASDLTKIDGGDIYAGSVTAVQGTFTTFNLVDNPGFEHPSLSWTLQAGASFQTDNPRSGSYELRYSPPADGEVNVAHSGYIPVRAGLTYYAECYCHAQGGATRTLGMRLQAFDKAFTFLTRYSPATMVTTAAGGYTRRYGLQTLASNVAFVRIELYAGTDSTVGTNAFWDDIVLREVTGMNVLVGIPGGARVEINNDGLEGYSDASTKQFYLRTSDGRGMFGGGKGVLDSAGIVLSGNETSYNTYNALRWQTVVDPPGGTAVARVAAGLFTPIETYGYYPTLQLYANPGLQTYGKLEALAYQSSTSYYEQLLLHNGYGHATALLRVVDNGAVKAGITLTRGSLDSGGVFLYTNNVERMRITDSGNVGLGGAPSHHLHIYGSGTQQGHCQSTNGQAGWALQNSATTANMYLPSGSSELSFWTAGARQAWFTSGGNAYKRDNTTNWSTTSDERLKQDIADLRGALGTIRQLRPVTYRWTEGYRPEDKTTHVGFLAQEWAQLFPEHVGTDDEGNMTMNLGPLPEYLVVAIQEIDARLSALEARGRAA